MKILTNQSHRGVKGLTTVALDGLHEANGLIKDCLGDPNFMPKHWKECDGILRSNQHYAPKDMKSNEDALRECLEQIEKGDPSITADAIKLCDDFVEHAKVIEPSITLERTYCPTEEGEIFDAGKIATSDPMAFFDRQRQGQPRSGRGDGAYRILINTDVAWWGDPTAKTASLMALVMLMQRNAPVEIWVQQGWWGGRWGGEASDGITLFKVFSGGVVQPQNIWFWIGSPYKDVPYSWAVNKRLGRVNSSVSLEAELPCDLYIYGHRMPRIEKPDDFATWVANTSKAMLFDEELPENWSGYQSKMPS